MTFKDCVQYLKDLSDEYAENEEKKTAILGIFGKVYANLLREAWPKLLDQP